MPTPRHPVALTNIELFRRAAKAVTWRQALGSLGLVASPENITAFESRAAKEKIDISSMRSRGPTDDISTDELRRAVDGAKTRAAVLRRLHLQAGGWTYRWLAEICDARSVELPAMSRRTAPQDRGRCPDDAIVAAYGEARSMADLLRRLGVIPAGGNYRWMEGRLERLGLDASELRARGRAWSSGTRTSPRRSLESYLQPNTRISGGWLAKRLVDAHLLYDVCYGCLGTTWCGQAIPLELDHINGDPTDNRLSNLRLLCPNCHALTPTYRGRNIGRNRKVVA